MQVTNSNPTLAMDKITFGSETLSRRLIVSHADR